MAGFVSLKILIDLPTNLDIETQHEILMTSAKIMLRSC